MNKYFLTISLVLALMLSACNKSRTTLSTGEWLFQLELEEEDKNVVLPINAVYNSESLIFRNGDERINVTEIQYSGDSVQITMPVFGSEFKGKLEANSIKGYYHNYNKGVEYKIPFIANYNETERFETGVEPIENISGKWDAWFLDSEGDSTKTIASFEQTGDKVIGTFFTEIGDYRYLEGVMDGSQLKLSTFDGGHAFLFLAELNEGGNLSGTFRSGHKFKQSWIASRNDKASLRGMKQLTYLNDGYDKLEFSFPDVSGSMISLDDEEYHNKVVIVQIFGTWCPNCMDETRYLVELHNKYHNQGLEIIGLDFEILPTMEYFKPRVQRFIRDLNVPYKIALAGSSDKKKAAEALPMLNHILSFPTAILIDRKGDIIEIHTGFSGPGTGDAYLIYKKEMEDMIEGLLAKNRL